MGLLPYRVKIVDHETALHNRYLSALADWVVRHSGKILIVVGGVSAVLVACVPQIELNDQWVEYFDERIEFRRDSDHAMQYFGLYPIEYSVPAQAPGGVSDPEYLVALEKLTAFLRMQPEVAHVYSISDVMKRLNKNLHADDASYYRIPDERALSAQYLLLYELSLPYGLDLNDRINIDKSASRVTATLNNLSTAETKVFLSKTQDWIQQHLPIYMQNTVPTSAQVMFTYISERNVNNMVWGTLVAVIAIAVIMIFSLRHIGMGVLSLVPNGLPILTTFGAWAILIGEVGFSVATVASISLGIIVDDTVHLLTKFVRARHEHQLSVVDAVRHAFNHVGVAILTNTFILTSGFAVLTFSAFKVNADMGLLTALSIVFALLLDFIFLPALLVFFFKRGEKNSIFQGGSMAKSVRIKSQQISGLGGLLLLLTLLGSALPQLNAWAADDDVALPGWAKTETQQKGFHIVAQSDRSDRGFEDNEVTLEMVLRNAAGEETSRSLQIRTLEMPNENVGDKSLVVFDSPRDIQGTALLSHAKILDPDDQWLFLPALKRVKRISSKNKSGPFVGSEFAFEDFTSLELNKYTYDWLREEPCGEFECDVVVRFPRYENSGYSKQVSWIDQTHSQVRRVDFYNRRDALLKTLELKEYKQYGTYWRAQLLHMVNHQNKKETELRYSDYQFGVGLKDSDFVKTRLTKLR